MLGAAIDISSTEPVEDTDFFYPLDGANPLPVVLREGNHKRNTMARDEPKRLLTIGFTLIKSCINGKKYPKKKERHGHTKDCQNRSSAITKPIPNDQM